VTEQKSSGEHQPFKSPQNEEFPVSDDPAEISQPKQNATDDFFLVPRRFRGSLDAPRPGPVGKPKPGFD
jgi:hypothetical protein